jgi:hypothetical protein
MLLLAGLLLAAITPSDSAAPLPPSVVHAHSELPGVALTWNASASPDVAGYRVYRTRAAGGPAELLVTLDPARRAYASTVGAADGLSVTAVDRAGHESVAAGANSVTVGSGFVRIVRTASGEVRVSWRLDRMGPARLDVFDAAGRRVRALAWGAFDPGIYRVTWDGRDERGVPAPPGVYVVRLDDAWTPSAWPRPWPSRMIVG